jgi:hypothetical protein
MSAHINTSVTLTASYKKEISEPGPESVKSLRPLYINRRGANPVQLAKALNISIERKPWQKNAADRNEPRTVASGNKD